MTLTFVESGGDVIVTWSGTADVTGATLVTSTAIGKFLAGTAFAGATSGVFQGGTAASGDFYTATMPTGMFGSTGVTLSDTSTGDAFGFNSAPSIVGLLVPVGFTSGSLSGTSTFSSTTFATLGLIEGTYSMTWGAGGADETATITVGTVPEPSSLLFGAAIALCVWRRRQTARDAA